MNILFSKGSGRKKQQIALLLGPELGRVKLNLCLV